MTMQWCWHMKRHETGVRRATGFLMVMLWLQASLRVTEAAIIPKQSEGHDYQTDVQRYVAVHPSKNTRRAADTVRLQTAVGPDGKVVPTLYENEIYIWQTHTINGNLFKLEDNGTSLVVSKKGLYFVNLRMGYYIPDMHTCTSNLFLSTSIKQHHTSYTKWIDVINSKDTMQCVDYWHQSVSLSQVVRFEKGTKLRVLIDPVNYPYIIGDTSTFFSVTRL
ncbi:uncharacterized protein LOC128603297 [Ictalurus furcatus]|uniref:uncharacterized protein LOC128603297 n=1 Tax=Ictalurus furcatus TaxID=66913 RepID=UPI002350B0AE|nr:uncharacterized protein LOC128603297 [Ictalurus furcatus]